MPRPPQRAEYDPFRTSCSEHEDEEAFVIALIPSGEVLEWSSNPVRALWLPEDFFGAFSRTAQELRLPLTSTLTDLHSRYRFSREELPLLTSEFEEISRHLDPPASRAAGLVAALLREGEESSRLLDAIIEGP